ncbi:hypothetical protein A2397_06135 [Candidatus Amesbacteria bacterium RIFOXYB1_FULL_44_23]|uniref:Glutamate--cysteine ligase n=1 Tax=Candidatus Amesbacteria bacterium RIFOXYB1_FULL_44_23 TaxID=1797263 RepID=A0A1F4ZXJ9_9BACT|nr:MAG: hypothetical protein A2397_06135 [Candidatus Amesbacteria bacterium RIFOXYB1_FULL_44_23]
MPGFKDAGKFTPASVKLDSEIAQRGGIDYDNMLAVKHPNYRLRKPGQENTRLDVSAGDITPIKAMPKPLARINLATPDTALMGIEAEFFVINSAGHPVTMYGADSVQEISEGNKKIVVVNHQGQPWDLDQIPGLTPEGLNSQVEIATSPHNSFEDLQKNLTQTLVPIATAFQAKGWLMLPTGLSGLPLKSDISNIPPHEYMVSIHTHGLKRTALTFDAQTVQSHVDQSGFGSSIEFSLALGNSYNAVLSTMINALSLSAPFWKGRSDSLLSHRESSRNQISTRGGVQDNIPVDALSFLHRGHLRVTAGEIPVPERAGGGKSNGSHNDYRPKLSTGTAEFGSSDSNPNPELWVAQTVVLRRFTEIVAQLVRDETGHLPSFLEMESFDVRKANRLAAAKNGVDAVISTKAGLLTIRQAWNNFFSWAKPKHSSPDWDRSVDVIKRTLAQNAKNVQDYFNPNSPNHLHGSVAVAMLRQYEQLSGPETDRIAQVNVMVASGFMGLIDRL